MNPDASLLFQPFRLGDLDLPNRVVMAPLTRNRAVAGLVPSPGITVAQVARVLSTVCGPAAHRFNQTFLVYP